MRFSEVRLFAWPGHALHLLAMTGLFMQLGSFGYAQASRPEQPQKRREVKQSNLQEEIANVKAGIITPYGLNFLGNAKATEAIPALEKQFYVVTDELDKAQIAQVLVQLGDQKTIYWDYLVELVTPILDADTPDPMMSNGQGKTVSGVSPAFEAWVSTNKQDLAVALENATLNYPGYVVFLGETEDSRAIPLLRRALFLQNRFIASQASEGLALLKDEGAVPLIIDAARKSSADVAAIIAEPLGYFKSPTAQAALDKYVPKDRAQRMRDRVKAGGRPLHE